VFAAAPDLPYPTDICVLVFGVNDDERIQVAGAGDERADVSEVPPAQDVSGAGSAPRARAP
jgi:hypothetical protein